MAIVAATAVIALIIVGVGLASLTPKSKPQSVNELPVAMFIYDANNLTVMFDATASSDPDGSIANYSWTFGDASEGSGKIVTHVYEKDGTYRANLVVTDNGGGENSSSKELTVKMTVSPAKKFPVAVIETEKDGLRVIVSGAKSHAEDDATITSYAWTFGDGGSATGVTATHTYAANGTYTISLTVTDSNGLTNSTTVSVKVATPPLPVMKYPVAVIQVDKDGLRVNVSGVKSHADDNATITSYAWTFGDGGSATGVTATHTYAANGTYTISLTVTDSNGLTNITTVSVKVASSPTPPLPPTQNGPPGLLHAIEIHKEKADRNSGLGNSLHQLQGNLEKWLDSHGTASTFLW